MASFTTLHIAVVAFAFFAGALVARMVARKQVEPSTGATKPQDRLN